MLAIGVVLALFFPQVSKFFEPYLLPSLFFVMVFSLLPFARIKTSNLMKLHPTVLALVVWQQFIIPGVVLIIGKWFQADQQLLYFVLLTVTSGSLFASPTLVQLMGLEQKMAVQTVIVSTMAAPVSIYLIFGYAQGNGVDLDFALFGFRLLMFLVVPIGIFLTIRLVINKWAHAAGDRIDSVGRWGSVISLVIFCFALEAEVTEKISTEPMLVIKYLFISILVATVVGISTRMVMAQFGIRAASTAMILASFRNVGLNFGLVGHIAGPNLAIYVGVCQIPMFFSPLLFDLFFGSMRKGEKKGAEAPDLTKSNDNSGSENPMGTDPQPHNEFQDTVMGNDRGALAQAAETITILGQPMRPQATSAGGQQSSSFATMQHGSAAAYDMAAYEQYEEQIDNYAEPVAQTRPAEIDEYLEDYLENQPASDTEDARALLEHLQQQFENPVVKPTPEVARARGAAAHLIITAMFIAVGMLAVWQANNVFSPYLWDYSRTDGIAQAHIEGRNYAVHDLNINIRDLRNATIAHMEKTPDVVVLGASHWQEAHVSSIQGMNFYNSHVHRDYYEDMLGVTEMWASHGKLPKKMVIAIRDNLLTPVADRTDFLWLAGIDYYRQFAERIGLQPHSRWELLPVQEWRERMSFKNAMNAGKTELTAPTATGPTDQKFFPTLDTLLPDGSILWSTEHRRIFTRQRADKEALDFARLRRNDPPKIDPKGIVHLEALFDYLVSKGVEVTFAHPPFNPVFWDAVKDSPYRAGLAKVEQLTKAWSDKYGFPIIGSFNPEKVGCDADMFNDLGEQDNDI
jgi:predicted Na+-dependent transporter